jgi:hypothetical protein
MLESAVKIAAEKVYICHTGLNQLNFAHASKPLFAVSTYNGMFGRPSGFRGLLCDKAKKKITLLP